MLVKRRAINTFYFSPLSYGLQVPHFLTRETNVGSVTALPPTAILLTNFTIADYDRAIRDRRKLSARLLETAFRAKKQGGGKTAESRLSDETSAVA